MLFTINKRTTLQAQVHNVVLNQQKNHIASTLCHSKQNKRQIGIVIQLGFKMQPFEIRTF